MADLDDTHCWVLISLVCRRRANEGDFARLWQDAIGAFDSSAACDRRIDNLVLEGDVGMPIAIGPWRFHAISQFEFSSREAMVSFESSALHDAYLGSISGFAANCTTLQTRRHVVIERKTVEAGPTGLIKRMSLLQRDPRVSRDVFYDWWLHRHGPKVSTLRALAAASQYHVLSGARTDFGEVGSTSNESIPDGVTELLLPSLDAMFATFSPTGNAITSGASEMIHRISPMIVEQLPI